MVQSYRCQTPANEDQRPRAVVTGGAGFLGSHLCERLIAEGVRVVCVDNLITGRLENIAHLVHHKDFSFVQHDVSQPIEIVGSVGYILHFASPASPKDYDKLPIQTLKAGGLGTYNMLGLAKAKRSVFLLASSSEVYGDPEVNPQPETYWGHVNPVGPRSSYDEAKRFSEAMATAYRREHGIDVRIARIFNCYGPRMRIDDGRVVPTFIAQALKNKPLTIYGDGAQTRSLCYVDDLIEGLFRFLMTTPEAINSTCDGIVNLGRPQEMSILQFAHKVLEATASDSGTVLRPLPEDDPKLRSPDIGRATHLLDWAPHISLDEGLKATISDIGQRLERLDCKKRQDHKE